jgi:hypothetical protein
MRPSSPVEEGWPTEGWLAITPSDDTLTARTLLPSTDDVITVLPQREYPESRQCSVRPFPTTLIFIIA